MSERIESREILSHHPQKLLILTDIGRDPDDMAALTVAAALTRQHLANVIGVVSTLTPAMRRAELARYTLDSLGLMDVPVAVGSDLPSLNIADVHEYEFSHLPEGNRQHVNATQLFNDVLEKAEDSSLNILVIASFADLARYLTASKRAQQLLKQKVNSLTIMGGIATNNDQILYDPQGFIIPDNSANFEFDVPASYFTIRYCQLARIPMTFVSRYAVYDAQLPRQTLDDLATTGHPIGMWLRNMSEKSFAHLWERACLPSDDLRRVLPARANKQWFQDTFCSGREVNPSQSIWEQIDTLSLYDPVALLAAIPQCREAYFTPVDITVNQTTHQIIGLNQQYSGVKDPTALKEYLQANLLSALSENR